MYTYTQLKSYKLSDKFPHKVLSSPQINNQINQSDISLINTSLSALKILQLKKQNEAIKSLHKIRNPSHEVFVPQNTHRQNNQFKQRDTDYKNEYQSYSSVPYQSFNSYTTNLSIPFIEKRVQSFARKSSIENKMRPREERKRHEKKKPSLKLGPSLKSEFQIQYQSMPNLKYEETKHVHFSNEVSVKNIDSGRITSKKLTVSPEKSNKLFNNKVQEIKQLISKMQLGDSIFSYQVI